MANPSFTPAYDTNHSFSPKASRSAVKKYNREERTRLAGMVPQQHGSWEFFLDGADGLGRALAIMVENTEDLGGVWPIYHRAFMEAEATAFRTRGEGVWQYGGGRSGRYVRWKQKHAPGLPLMVLTGATRDSLVAEGPGHIYEPHPRYVKFGTTQPPAEYNYRRKGRHRKKVIDKNANAMQNSIRAAVAEHAEAYARMWNGGSP